MVTNSNRFLDLGIISDVLSTPIAVLSACIRHPAVTYGGVIDISERIDALVGRSGQRDSALFSQKSGGTRLRTKRNYACRGLFEDVVRTREYSPFRYKRWVPDKQIYEAVDLVRHTPSVCNRQAWRVRWYSSAHQKSRIFKRQNRNAGFGSECSHVSITTSDLREFGTSGERNQCFVDGGIFAMNLSLALENEGLAARFLNWSMGCRADLTMRKATQIPGSESIVTLMAVGAKPYKYKICVSAKKPAGEVLSFYD